MPFIAPEIRQPTRRSSFRRCHIPRPIDAADQLIPTYRARAVSAIAYSVDIVGSLPGQPLPLRLPVGSFATVPHSARPPAATAPLCHQFESVIEAQLGPERLTSFEAQRRTTGTPPAVKRIQQNDACHAPVRRSRYFRDALTPIGQISVIFHKTLIL
jgi:hypothetical protein